MMNEESNKPVPIGERGIVLRSLESMTQFAAMVLKSKLAPREFNDIPSVCIAIQYGLELGLTPMAALQGVAVINGKPSVYGDSALAVCYGTGLVEEFSEFFEGEGDDFKAVCVIRRRGLTNEKRSEFSVKDAKRAKLWGKSGPWTQYPKRMLQMRARSFALRDTFSDALKGVILAEEAMDYPSSGGSGGGAKTLTSPTIDVTKGKAKVTVIAAPTPKKPEPLVVDPGDVVQPLVGRRGRKTAQRKLAEDIFNLASEGELDYGTLEDFASAVADEEITAGQIEERPEEELKLLLAQVQQAATEPAPVTPGPSLPKKPELPAEGGKGGATQKPRTINTGKSAPVRKLLGSPDYRSLMSDGAVAKALGDWCDHLDTRLQKVYSPVGARKFCARVAEWSTAQIVAAVDYSLEGNYQKLVEPNGKTQKPAARPARPDEYAEPTGAGPTVAD